MRPKGYVIYRGPSQYDGGDVVVIATGFGSDSANVKTGALIQTWIMRADIEPHTALAQGLDATVCGTCRYRSVASGGGGGCYVLTFQGPLAVWRAWKRGIYPDATDPRVLAAIGAGRKLRLGSYGDPAAVPIDVWRAFTLRASKRFGYTHGWRTTPELSALCMASVDTVAEAREARASGWRYFRVAPVGDATRERGEGRCPASKESGYKLQCEACPIACMGAASMPNIVIQAHGAGSKRASIR